jgi:hypothetical protein
MGRWPVDKPTPVERALLARDVRGVTTVLATDGSYTDWICEEVTSAAGDVGLPEIPDDQPPGLYLAEGRWKPYASGPDYHTEFDFDGTVRPVTPDEVPGLFAMEPPTCPACGGSGEDGDESGRGPCGACDGTGERKAATHNG